MSISTPLYDQLFSLLSQYSRYRDLRHLKALAWMINALICSSKINLSEWESYVISRATKAQSAFQLEESKVCDRHALERLYLVVALALLFSTVDGMAIQIKGLRQRVDPHFLAWY